MGPQLHAEDSIQICLGAVCQNLRLSCTHGQTPEKRLKIKIKPQFYSFMKGLLKLMQEYIPANRSMENANKISVRKGLFNESNSLFDKLALAA